MAEPSGRLAGRIALVTGASRGIGRAVAKRFAQEGATVVAVARTKPDLLSLDDEIKELTGTNAVLVDEDLTDFDTIDRVGAALFERYKKLDILVGVAGTLGQLSPTSHVPPNIWEQTMALNATAHWRTLRSVEPLLRQSESGRVLFVTCSQGSLPAPFWSAYGASKAALEYMTLSYAEEMKESSVRANLIDPGPVRTRLRTKAFPGEDEMKLPTPDEVTDEFVELAAAECDTNGQRVTITR